MHLIRSALIVSFMLLPVSVVAQTGPGAQAPSAPSIAAPRLINLSGIFRPADGQPIGRTETVTFAVYADEFGGAPIWQETQMVEPDASGRYTVLLGATRPDGVPLEVFASGEARWLGMVWGRGGAAEARRSRLTFVPYALRAADADTLGGKPASAYALAAPAEASAATSTGAGGATDETTASSSTNSPTPYAILPGSANYLTKYVNSSDVGSSTVYDAGGRFGFNTTFPADILHAQFTNNDGSMTGLAVQNLGGTSASYSGMLFLDQIGAVANFQGFNNSTHEYRINNVAKNVSAQFNGTINFMIGGSSKFFVSPISVGIGTTAPSPTANLDVSNAISGSGTTNVNVTTYSANASGPNVIGKKARGTQAAPTSVLNNDALLDLSANGYGATGFAALNSASISMRTSENWTDTAQGSIINFSTTANGTTGPIARMTIGASGRVGIGVSSAQAPLEVSNFNNTFGAGMIYSTTFTNAGTSLFVGRRARGTGLAPTAVLSGDNLVGYEGAGYGTTGFSVTRGGMVVTAAENWTDTAQGARLHFTTTATGTTSSGTRMTIDPVGNVGIGTASPAGALEVARSSGDYDILFTAYAGEANVLTRKARGGNPAAPTAVLLGNELGSYFMAGYGSTAFSTGNAGMLAKASENWTDTAQGALLAFGVTPTGTTATDVAMAIAPSSHVGIGAMAVDGDGLPILPDQLHVIGDIRVGTSGTNGCVKDFSGTGIVGSCSSDLRLKKDITPFGAVLDKLSALQPVHYFWRASDFPERHFGNSQAAGLIAQDVEQVLPELVETQADGFKAVNYSALPLLTIQAVKELKTENDALKQRVTDLERRLAELMAVIGRR